MPDSGSSRSPSQLNPILQTRLPFQVMWSGFWNADHSNNLLEIIGKWIAIFSQVLFKRYKDGGLEGRDNAFSKDN